MPAPARLLRSFGARRAAVSGKLHAVRFADGTHRFATAANGGELGVATGFGNITLVYLRRMPTTVNVIRAKIGSSGWQQVISTSGLNCNYHNATSFVASPNIAITPSMVGRLLVVVSRITATPGVLELALDTMWAPTTPAMASYLGAAVAEGFGNDSAAGYPSIDADVVASLDFRGTPTRSQIDALMLAARALSDLPTTLTGATVTHRHSLKETLAGQTITAGQVAPATLPDSVTAATADAYNRTGSPTITEIDVAAIDGRKSYGVFGYGPTTYLQTANPGGVGGSTAAFNATCHLRIDAAVTASQFIMGRTNNSNAGWELYAINANTLVFYAVETGGNFRSINYSFAGLIGADLIVTVVWTGSAMRLYIDGVQIGSDYAFTQSFVPFAGPLQIGQVGGAVPASSFTVFAVSASDNAVTAAAITSMVAASRAAGRLQAIAGGQHLWDLTQDITTAGPDAGVPASILDRIGTDHLTRVGQMNVNGTGLRTFTTQYPISTTVATGLPGVATGWWVECLVRVVQSSAMNQVVFSNTGASSNGLNLYVQANSLVLRAGFADGTTGFNVDALVTAGALVHVAAVYTGTIGQLYINGSLVGSTAAFTYAPGSAPTKLGTLYAGGVSWSFDQSTHYGASGGHAVPTAGEISAASTYAHANGRVGGIAGKTLRRYSIVDDIADAGGRVPPIVKERAAGVATDALVMQGSPLQVSRRTERAWSYEATPILYGAAGFTAANYYSHAGGISMDPGGSWASVLFRIDQQTGLSSALRIMASKCDPTSGWTFYTQGLNSTFFGFCNGASTPSTVLAAADVGKLMLAVMVLDPVSLKLRMYIRRAQAADGTTINSSNLIAQQPAEFQIGRRVGDIYPANGVTVFGVAGGLGVPPLAEVQALHDHVMAAEDMQSIPGRTAHLYSVKLDAIAAGNAIPATITDRVGSDHLARQGSPTLSAHHARAYG